LGSRVWHTADERRRSQTPPSNVCQGKGGTVPAFFLFGAESQAWMGIRSQQFRVLLGLLVTFAALYFIPNRLLALMLLLLSWLIIFKPLRTGELVLFGLAAPYFLLQNYVCLKAGLFEFRFKDILFMPYYEPLLWGFYFMSMKRFISADQKDDVVVDKRSLAGVVVTSMMFSIFSFNSHALFIATACSTIFLFLLFHTKTDLYYALYALILGLVVELFGVSSGLWSYPAPDFLGIPYWFATMWISVGLLGRRFLIPAARWLAARVEGQRA
jgi:hypothetical protein